MHEEAAPKKKKVEEEEKMMTGEHRESVDLMPSDSGKDEAVKSRALSSAMEEIVAARSKSFDRGIIALGDSESYLLVERGIIREMLLEGDFAKAEAFIKENFSSLWEEDKNIKFSIGALQFIELLKEGKPTEAIEYARNQLNENAGEARFISRDAEGHGKALGIEDLFSLLCYERMEESPVRHLLSPIQREAVGDYINSKILTMKSKDGITALEKSLKQLVAVQNYQMEKYNLGATFNLKI
eukprot:TRINITY_DN71966_c0_g1_i1.p2 TRINITY_DN71966_c0_g1~~TRINITY_DN71966_c0_g1_i1.p2  ORF type:complete len:241 (-),score=48.34 TRINITY_DN71966_c0_g1_i1:72-794(-)